MRCKKWLVYKDGVFVKGFHMKLNALDFTKTIYGASIKFGYQPKG